MPGLLYHSPAHVLLALMTDKKATSWPMFVDLTPDDDAAAIPDDIVVIENTEGQLDGRTQIDGETQMHHGIMITLRTTDKVIGYRMANQIADFLDKRVLREKVRVTEKGGFDADYFVHAFNRTSDVLSLGYDAPDTRRSIYTQNGTLDVVMTRPPNDS